MSDLRWRLAPRTAPQLHATRAEPPPVPFVVGPYTLLHTSEVVGRQKELDLLTDWVADPATDMHRARVLVLLAIGGMGKSALTWKWFHDIASRELPALVGRVWWSFYETDARFDNFVLRTLGYVTGRSVQELRALRAPEREEELDAAQSFTGQARLRITVDPRTGTFLRRLAGLRASRVLITSRLSRSTCRRRTPHRCPACTPISSVG